MNSAIERLIGWIEAHERLVSASFGGVIVGVVGVLVLMVALNPSLDMNFKPKIEIETVNEGENLTPIFHTVAANEGLSSIAQMYYGNKDYWVKIAEANNIANPNLITIGQVLEIPHLDGVVTPVDYLEGSSNRDRKYVVKRGDYLTKIAIEVYGNKDRWLDILNANRSKITNPEVLEAGMVLDLP